jgi:hypothetical protein
MEERFGSHYPDERDEMLPEFRDECDRGLKGIARVVHESALRLNRSGKAIATLVVAFLEAVRGNEEDFAPMLDGPFALPMESLDCQLTEE